MKFLFSVISMKVHLVSCCVIIVITSHLHCGEASMNGDFRIQEFSPYALSRYKGNLENAELLYIYHESKYPFLTLKFAANVTNGCSLSNITLFARHGGLPLVNINNATYPNDTWVYRPIDYQMNFLSDNEYNTLTVNSSNYTSHLFATAFVLDDTSRIQQEGLTISCKTLLWGRVETQLTEVNSSKPDNRITDVRHLIRKDFPQSLNTQWILEDKEHNVSDSSDFVLDLRPSDEPSLFSWLVSYPTDVGGTLFIVNKFKSNDTNSSAIGCITYESPYCGDGSYNFSVNYSEDEEGKRSKIFVPYPLAGKWFLSLRANCSGMEGFECEDNVTVNVQISMSSCQEGTCGSNGRCISYFSSGLIYSTCVCSNGYSGWACSDDSNAYSFAMLLASVLLLTLSNLFFLPSIILAFRRKFYPQCLIYCSAMFFSGLYHACDQNAFCLMPYAVLQYGDFYSALTSVWLTSLVVGQPRINRNIMDAISLAGTVGIAISVRYNPNSLPSLLIPIACGVFLITISWIQHGRRKKTCHPGRSYCLKAVLPCFIFAGTGFLCFAFLETEDNYYYVHSIWHISIALAILFVLPRNSEPELELAH